MTSIGLPVSFKVEGTDIIDLHYGFSWGYCGVSEEKTDEPVPIGPEKMWRFKYLSTSIEGTFLAPDRVEGTVRAYERELPACVNSHATFVAIPGETPPPTPVQFYAVVDSESGHQSRSPWQIFLGRDGSLHLDLYGLRWHDFRQPVAHATGWAGIRRFKRHWAPKATVTLSHPIEDGPGKKLYSLLHYSLHGRLPNGYPRKGWLEFDRHRVVASSDPRWPGGSARSHRSG